MTKAEMREQIERAMSEFKGEIQRSEKVLGEVKGYTANYRAGTGRSRLGKNGGGKYSMSETNARRSVWS
jgi:hypothetical protein